MRLKTTAPESHRKKQDFYTRINLFWEKGFSETAV